MVIEFARHVFNSDEPNSTEFDPDTRYPVIDFMPEQKKLMTKGATMRLGNYPCKLHGDTLAAKAYGQASHIRNATATASSLTTTTANSCDEAGLVYSGLSPDGTLVEICELTDHPWMVGCQFHPEFGSRPNRPHPLFRDFIGAAKDVLREGAQPPLPLQAD